MRDWRVADVRQVSPNAPSSFVRRRPRSLSFLALLSSSCTSRARCRHSLLSAPALTTLTKLSLASPTKSSIEATSSLPHLRFVSRLLTTSLRSAVPIIGYPVLTLFITPRLLASPSLAVSVLPPLSLPSFPFPFPPPATPLTPPPLLLSSHSGQTPCLRPRTNPCSPTPTLMRTSRRHPATPSTTPPRQSIFSSMMICPLVLPSPASWVPQPTTNTVPPSLPPTLP